MLEEIIKVRKNKVNILRDKGIDPYPASIKRTHSLYELVKNFITISRARKKISAAGRVLGLRDQGKLIFIDIDDGSFRIQAILTRAKTPNFDVIKTTIDIGDFVEVAGILIKTKKGEKSIESTAVRIIMKSIRPIPAGFYGIEDTEIRLRKRYLELALHQDAREIFIKKAIFWKTFRSALEEKGFLEVETPVLEHTPGGADAEPFMTYYNALDTNFYLRISLEISLKKLLVGGFEKVFEIGRIFRNEGIDAEHLQDYTQLEFYWAYADYNELMKFIEKTYKKVIKQTTGSLITTWKGQKIDWSKKWPIVDYFSIFKKKTGIDLNVATLNDLLLKAKELNISADKSLGKGRLIDLLFKKVIRPEMIQPCLLINPPLEIEPLAKRIVGDDKKVARFQVLACGSELGKGFSEANDPVDERERFEEQMKLREQGDKEAQILDEDFLEALEYGMPPAAGFGISERLFAVIMDKPVRETVFFPAMKKQN